MALTPRQQAFVDAYTGNATQAAKDAGYSDHTAHAQGHRLLKNAEVAAAIAARSGAVRKARIKTREELQQMWSDVADDPNTPMRDRLRASELLGKSRGEFSEKLEVKGELGILDLVRESMEGK